MTFRTDPEGYQVYARDPETLARDWVKPGTPGLLHRIGGIEKHHLTGDISYDADNHQKMTDNRRNKILGIAGDIPDQAVDQGREGGKDRGRRVGFDPRADRPGRLQHARPGPRRVPHPHPPYLADAAQSWATC